MKAAQFSRYGDTSVIEINENAPVPELKEGHVLVQVKAASLNPFDANLRKGTFAESIPMQFPVTLCGDFSGVITEVGEGVENFKKGDEVYGQSHIVTGGTGSLAEYTAAKSSNIAIRPQSIGFDQAAALPLTGISAIQALEENMKLSKGQKVLIHGGAGGIGSIAIQLAKHLGAFVASTVGTDDMVFAKALGADEVHNYESESFEKHLSDFDAVLDTVGKDTFTHSFEVLKKGGILVSMKEEDKDQLAAKYGVTAIHQQSRVTTARLERLAQLVIDGAIKVQIDREYHLNQAAEAFTHLEKEHPRGKVVVTIG